MIYFRSPDLLKLAAGESCTLRFSGCAEGPCVSAHSNMSRHGKGKSIKAHDCFVCWACASCHYELDQGKNRSREKKAEAFQRAHEETLPKLLSKAFEQTHRQVKSKPHKGTALTSSKIVPRRELRA